MPNKMKKPIDIPADPGCIYKLQGWKGLKDWLGTENIEPYRKFYLARKFARNLSLKSKHEWKSYCNGQMSNKKKMPTDVPKTPQNVYRESGWKGYPDWLGY
jgi:hypothetical protein